MLSKIYGYSTAGCSDRCSLLPRLFMTRSDGFFKVVSVDRTHIQLDQLCFLTFWKICNRYFSAPHNGILLF